MLKNIQGYTSPWILSTLFQVTLEVINLASFWVILTAFLFAKMFSYFCFLSTWSSAYSLCSFLCIFVNNVAMNNLRQMHFPAVENDWTEGYNMYSSVRYGPIHIYQVKTFRVFETMYERVPGFQLDMLSNLCFHHSDTWVFWVF